MVDTDFPDFALDQGDEGYVLRVSGDWTVATVPDMDEALRELAPGTPLSLDVTNLGRLDTAGAFVLDRTLRAAMP